jgi:hypothetical protein
MSQKGHQQTFVEPERMSALPRKRTSDAANDMSASDAAMFMYDDDHGSRLVVLTRPMSSADQSAPMTRQSRGDVGGFA